MIYCVEDDNSIREIVVYTLNNSGFEAKGFDDGESFFNELKKEKPELILLDIMLPGEDGIKILKKIRNNIDTKKIPVIMVTAKDTEYDKVIGLDMGADDYVSKPFGMMELVSRIKAVLRRSGNIKGEDEYKYKNIILNLKKHTVTVDDNNIELTLKEFELLKLLIKSPGTVFSRELLLENVWGYDFICETRTVDVHIRTLRTKLGEAGNIIETVRGVGYKVGE